MNVAAASTIDEDVYLGVEDLDQNERRKEKDHPWIKVVDASEYYDEGADRYARMGIVARAAYDLAALNAANKEYERVIVECIAKQDRNRKLMQDLEKARKTAIENESMYSQARSGYRQTSKETSAAKKASIVLAAKPMPAYLSSSIEAKKRKVGEKSVALFGSKPVTKKIRTAKSVPLADFSSNANAEAERLREVVTNPAGGGGEEASAMGALYVTAQNVSEEADAVVLEEC